MATLLERARGSVTAKVLFIGVLVLALLIPVGMIQGLVRERAQRYEGARAEIANAWGGAQTIGGPILVVPFRHTITRSAGPALPPQTAVVADELYVLPEALAISADITVEERERGIYRVPVYTARLTASGTLGTVTLPKGLADLEVLWDDAVLALPLSDARSIREPVEIVAGDEVVELGPGGTRVPGFGEQLVAPLAAFGPETPEASRAFSFDITFAGTTSLRFLPLGDATRVNLEANWPSPSFNGAYLPTERSVSDDGFSAGWSMLSLGRGFPSQWPRSAVPFTNGAASAFGVALIDPVGVHTATLRAVKYAVLFIGLTFGAYFLFELLAGLRLHALQYLLIGLANCVFYVLLLALAEHVGFKSAYVVSAAAAAALIGGYSSAVLRSLRRAAPIAALLLGLYAYLYVTLQAEDYALLIGAVGLFTVLAALMYLTRHVDWHAVSFELPNGRRAAAAAE